MPTTDTKANPFPKQTLARGVGNLSSLEAIGSNLEKQITTLSPKLIETVSNQLKSKILPEIKLKNIDDQKINQIAQEVIREALENLPRVANLPFPQEALSSLLTDSLISTINVDDELLKSFKKSPKDLQKLIPEVIPLFQEVAKSHEKDLEQIAISANLHDLTSLQKPNQETLNSITTQIRNTVEQKTPLNPEYTNYLSGAFASYVPTYLSSLNAKLQKLPAKKPSSLGELAKIKEEAHNQALAGIHANLLQSPTGKTILNRIDFDALNANLAVSLGFKNSSTSDLETLGLGRANPKTFALRKISGFSGLGLALGLVTNKKLQEAGFLSLLAYDSERLDQNINSITKELEQYQPSKNLSYKNRKRLQKLQMQLGILEKSRAASLKNPKQSSVYRSFFPTHQGLLEASNLAWQTTETSFGNTQLYVANYNLPTNPASHLASRFFAGLALNSGIKNVSFDFPRPTAGATKLATTFKSSPMSLILSTGTGIMRKIANTAAGLLTGLGIYAFMLGKAAFTGFMIGASLGVGIGGGVGAYLGFQVALAAGPFAPFVGLITVPLGAFAGAAVGGFVGGLAGTLIGLGVASGSSTLVAMGVGSSLGGVIGAGIGGTLGFTIGASLAGIPVIGPLIAPFAAPLGAMIGASIGAMVGSAIGAALGYAIGHYLLGTIGMGATLGATIGFITLGPLGILPGMAVGWLIDGGWIQVKNFLSGGVSSVSNIVLGTISNFFVGAITALWNGIVAFGSAVLSGISAFGNFLLGSLGGISFSLGFAAAPFFGAIAIIAAATIFIATISDTGQGQAGETITKISTPATVTNRESFDYKINYKDSCLPTALITDNLPTTVSLESIPQVTILNNEAVESVNLVEPAQNQLVPNFSGKIVWEVKLKDNYVSGCNPATPVDIPPNQDTCGGKYSLDNPFDNFGDPQCNFSKNGLYQLLQQYDAANAQYWFDTIVPCESSYNPNSFLAASASGLGAYGLYQMNPKGQGNNDYDAGNVVWTLQTTNAINYNNGLITDGNGWRYWACAQGTKW